jgi:polyisoprenoid-binding protein YceI
MTRFRFASAALGVVALAVAPAAAETWQIDSAHSNVTFSVTHMMISTVRGEFGGGPTGTIRLAVPLLPAPSVAVRTTV